MVGIVNDSVGTMVSHSISLLTGGLIPDIMTALVGIITCVIILFALDLLAESILGAGFIREGGISVGGMLAERRTKKRLDDDYEMIKSKPDGVTYGESQLSDAERERKERWSTL